MSVRGREAYPKGCEAVHTQNVVLQYFLEGSYYIQFAGSSRIAEVWEAGGAPPGVDTVALI